MYNKADDFKAATMRSKLITLFRACGLAESVRSSHSRSDEIDEIGTSDSFEKRGEEIDCHVGAHHSLEKRRSRLHFAIRFEFFDFVVVETVGDGETTPIPASELVHEFEKEMIVERLERS